MADLDMNAIELAAASVSGWGNCNAAWIDSSEDVDAAVVGHIDEDGEAYPVAVVDCEQYYSVDSLKLAKFYAAANPAVVLELIARLRAAEHDAARYRFLRARHVDFSVTRALPFPQNHILGKPAMATRYIGGAGLALDEAVDREIAEARPAGGS